jgi:hypothetical protein
MLRKFSQQQVLPEQPCDAFKRLTNVPKEQERYQKIVKVAVALLDSMEVCLYGLDLGRHLLATAPEVVFYD